jgi:CheY-like chemotaxis protein
MDAYVSKPIDAEELTRAIEHALGASARDGVPRMPLPA